MNIIVIAVVVLGVIILGGGGALIFFLSNKPKRQSWKAYVYQLGDGVIDLKEKQGEKEVKYKLSELKPYTNDVAIKIDKKDGATHYWLTGLKKPIPVITADCVEVWGQKDKIIRILLHEDSCTLLKMGYDRKLGDMIFRPMDHDRINMIKTELSERNARIENTKDILTQITPWIVVGISMIALVVVAYFNAQAGVKIAEYNNEINDESIQAQKEIATMYVQGINGQLANPERQIRQEEPPSTIPP